MHSTRPYRHGNLPVALIAAARQILDENGFEVVGLRETARQIERLGDSRNFAAVGELPRLAARVDEFRQATQ